MKLYVSSIESFGKSYDQKYRVTAKSVFGLSPSIEVEVEDSRRPSFRLGDEIDVNLGELDRTEKRGGEE